MIEVINVPDPEKWSPEEVPGSRAESFIVRRGSPGSQETGRKLTDIPGFCKERIG